MGAPVKKCEKRAEGTLAFHTHRYDREYCLELRFAQLSGILLGKYPRISSGSDLTTALLSESQRHLDRMGPGTVQKISPYFRKDTQIFSLFVYVCAHLHVLSTLHRGHLIGII